MGEAGQRGYVTMILRSRVTNPNPIHQQHQPQIVNFPYDVVVARNEHEGFGFVIISASNQYYGSTIGKFLSLILWTIFQLLIFNKFAF